MLLFYAFIFLLSLYIVKYISSSTRYKLPPGPIGLPILGYLPFLGKEAYKKLHILSQKYGNVFSLCLGRNLVVVLGNFESVQEVLSNNDAMDRPPNPPNHLLPNSTSLSVSNGNVWKEQRNFAVQMLRKLGMGKEIIEKRVEAEIKLLMEKIDSESGKPMNLHRILLPSVSNVVLSMLLGKVDEGIRELLDSSIRIMTLYFRPTRIHAYFPKLRKWLARFGIWGYDNVEKTMKELSLFFESSIEWHRNTLDPSQVRNYVDAFLLTAEKDKNKVKTQFTDTMLRGNIQSLLGAGSTPPRATIEWCLVEAAMNPNIQEGLYKEVVAATEGGFPTWADRHATPYTMSFIYEVMRHHTVIPISMLRTNSRDIQIRGYDIPAGTIIMSNLWGVHHDPAHWSDPHEFKPERFLIDGKAEKPAAFIPFSCGRRNCPGEDLGMMEVYLFFTALIQRYEVKPANADRHGFKTLLGIANMAVPDNIRMLIREKHQKSISK